MRRFLWLAAAAAVVCLPANGRCQQQSQPAQNQTAPSQAQAPAQTNSSAAPVPQQDSLADAARKAREQKKEAPKAAKVFDNDNIPTSGGVNTVGGSAAPSDQNAPSKPAAENDEKAWRDRFATLHHKLQQDEQELAILQRELGVANVQFYNDPVKQMQQSITNDDIHKKQAAIDAQQKAIDADKQAIDNAEEELRKAGGDPGWAR